MFDLGQEPGVLQKSEAQELDAGPAVPEILQWPSTASSGLKLTRISRGAS